MMIVPQALPNNPRIGICAPSSCITPARFESGCAWLRGHGATLVIHPQTYEDFGQIAGHASARAAALKDLLCDDTLDAVIFAAGGHRSAEILPLLDWQTIARHKPKIVMGYSDGSMIVNAIAARLRWITLFGPTVQSLPSAHDSLWDVLRGATPFSVDLAYSGPRVQGHVIASTLTLLPLLLHSDDILPLDGALLCLEECNEELSTIDRHMLLLKKQGVFDRIAGLVSGSFTNMTDTGRPFGFTLPEIIKHHAGDIPLASNAPFGHGDGGMILPIGSVCELDNDRLSALENTFPKMPQA